MNVEWHENRKFKLRLPYHRYLYCLRMSTMYALVAIIAVIILSYSAPARATFYWTVSTVHGWVLYCIMYVFLAFLSSVILFHGYNVIIRAHRVKFIKRVGLSDDDFIFELQNESTTISKSNVVGVRRTSMAFRVDSGQERIVWSDFLDGAIVHRIRSGSPSIGAGG